MSGCSHVAALFSTSPYSLLTSSEGFPLVFQQTLLNYSSVMKDFFFFCGLIQKKANLLQSEGGDFQLVSPLHASFATICNNSRSAESWLESQLEITHMAVSQPPRTTQNQRRALSSRSDPKRHRQDLHKLPSERCAHLASN